VRGKGKKKREKLWGKERTRRKNLLKRFKRAPVLFICRAPKNKGGGKKKEEKKKRNALRGKGKRWQDLNISSDSFAGEKSRKEKKRRSRRKGGRRAGTPCPFAAEK